MLISSHAVANSLEESATPWPELLAQAEKEGVLPLVLHTLSEKQKAQLDAVFLGCLGVSISHYVRQHIAREMMVVDELCDLATALSAEGLPFLVFKGTALAYGLYEQPHLRVRSDTDLLLSSREDADQAWEIMRLRGFERPSAVDGSLITSEFTVGKRSGAGVVLFDVHWNTNNALHCRSLTFDELFAESIVLERVSPLIRAPCPVHSFILACHHRIAHMPEGLHNRLIWLHDLHLLLTGFGEEDRQHLLRLIQQHGIASVCWHGIEAARTHFATALDANWLADIARLADDKPQLISANQSRLNVDLMAIRQQRGIYNKLLILKEYLLPSAAYITAKYGVRHRCLLPYYYAKRALCGAIKRL